MRQKTRSFFEHILFIIGIHEKFKLVAVYVVAKNQGKTAYWVLAEISGVKAHAE